MSVYFLLLITIVGYGRSWYPMIVLRLLINFIYLIQSYIQQIVLYFKLKKILEINSKRNIENQQRNDQFEHQTKLKIKCI